MATTRGKDRQGRGTWCWRWRLPWTDITVGIARRVGLKCDMRDEGDKARRRVNRNNRAHAHKAKDALYRRQKGRCKVCGRPFAPRTMQCHHLLPQSRYPELGSVRENIALVCPDCHLEIHNNPFLNSRLMVEAACRMGIDLKERYRD